MNPFLIIPHYVSWHYTTGIKGFLSLWKTFLWFLWHTFSIKLLLQTLFQPFQRLKESSKGNGLDLEAFFSALVTNLLMRLIGFFMRSIVIIFGLFCTVFLLVGGGALFLIWLTLPFVLLAVVIMGFGALFNFSRL